MSERLTERNETNTAYYFPMCIEKCDGLGSSSKCDGCELMHNVCEKLGKYEELEEQGLLLRLPCKVGDTVYSIHYLPLSKKSIIAEVENVDMFFLLLSVAENRFGKTVFLTQSEAEEKLKELEKSKSEMARQGM